MNNEQRAVLDAAVHWLVYGHPPSIGLGLERLIKERFGTDSKEVAKKIILDAIARQGYFEDAVAPEIEAD